MSALRTDVARLIARGEHRAVRAALAAAVQTKPTAATCHLVTELLDGVDAAGAGLTDVRVALLTNYTVDPFVPILTARALPSGLRVRAYVPAFNTWMQETVDPHSALRTFQPEVVILDLVADALCPTLSRAFLSLDQAGVTAAVDTAAAVVTDTVRALRTWSSAKLLVQALPRPLGPVLGILDTGPSSQREAIARVNELIGEVLAGQDASLVDTDRLVAEVGAPAWRDARHWALASVPYTPAAMHRIAEEHLRYLRAMTGRVRKVLVLDLDDTLWGGVLGERGADGIDLGATYPGVAFVELQQAVAEFQRRGVVLALNSSNDADEAVRVIDTHPSMVLRLDAFAAHRINWQDKARNMQALADDLGLGLDSFVFIDNSDAECARMRQALPEVLTLQLSGEPAGYAAWLRTAGVFDTLRYTDEDRQRGALYRGEAARASHRGTVGSMEGYLQSLEMELSLEPVSAMTLGRAADLTQRTNQFNLTTRRLTADALREWLANGTREGYVCTLTDRFGPQGIVALATLETLPGGEVRIADLLVSCRVLKRGVEQAILALLVTRARDHGARVIVGEVRPTPRNAPFVDFYTACGFTEQPASVPGDAGGTETRRYIRSLDMPLDVPGHVRTELRAASAESLS